MDLSDRSKRKDGRYHERHDAYAPCGRNHPLPASSHSGKRQQAVSGLIARKRRDMHGEQTVERRHNTDNLWSENTPPSRWLCSKHEHFQELPTFRMSNIRSDFEQKTRHESLCRNIFSHSILLYIRWILLYSRKAVSTGAVFVLSFYVRTLFIQV
jgi:hypothetical protein